MPLSLLFGLLLVIPNVENITRGTIIGCYLLFLSMIIFSQPFWISRRADTEKETWLLNRSHAAPFYLASCSTWRSLPMIVLCYTVWFSVRRYPLIPFSLGGGKPLTVAFSEGEKKMPDEIQKVDTDLLSGPFPISYFSRRKNPLW
jgi:hypothetical protein